MLDFTYHNPTRLICCDDWQPPLAQQLARYSRVLVILDRSIAHIYRLEETLRQLLSSHQLNFFTQINENSELESVIHATEVARTQKSEFILAIGGGSIIDAAKFVSCAVNYPNNDLWSILLASGYQQVQKTIPLGIIATYPSAGSEMNPYFVASSQKKARKIACYAPMVHPDFAILDPHFLYSLSDQQLALGMADSLIHILEQYLVSDQATTLQNMQAATLIKALLSSLPKVMAQREDLVAGGNLMLASTLALNGLIESGTKSDWMTHWLSHELTALHGLKHAEAVLVLYPTVVSLRQHEKQAQLLNYAQLVWETPNHLTAEQQIEQALQKTWDFLRSLGLKLRLADYGVYQLDNEKIISNVFEFSCGQNLGECETGDAATLSKILERALAN